MAATLDPETAALMRANRSGGYGAAPRADERNTGIRPGQNPDLPTNEQKAAAAATRVNAQNQAVRDRDPYGKPLAGTGAAQAGGYDQRYGDLQKQLELSRNRTAPQAQAAELAAARAAGGANVGAVTNAQAAQLAEAERAAGVQMGAAQSASAGSAAAAKIAATERAQDSAFRGGQEEAAKYLTGLMRGDNSVAALQAKRASDQAIAAQMAMARSGRPGQGGMNSRLAAQNIGKIQGDLASRTMEAQLAERNAATGQLSGLLGTARGQDLSLSQFNAAQGNEASRLQAQLGTQASIANAGNQTQAGIANMQSANSMAQRAAELAQQNNQFNAQAGNQFASQRAQLAQDVNLANAAASNQRNLAEASLDLNSRQFDASAENQRNALAAQLAQNNSQFNVGAQLQTTGMNDAAAFNALQGQLANAQLQQQGNQFGLSLEQQRYLQNQSIDAQMVMQQRAINAAKPKSQSFLGSLGNGLLSLGTAALPLIGGAIGGPAGAAGGGMLSQMLPQTIGGAMTGR